MKNTPVFALFFFYPHSTMQRFVQENDEFPY
jgi:hypothetical protein